MAKVCPNCGESLKQAAKFCDKCGTKVGEEKKTDTKAKEVKTETVSKPVNTQPKSKLAAGLLGIFLGSLGIHNFYLGYTGKAVAQLLISVLSCFFLSPISAIWGLIEGILILTGSINVDAQGNYLGE